MKNRDYTPVGVLPSVGREGGEWRMMNVEMWVCMIIRLSGICPTMKILLGLIVWNANGVVWNRDENTKGVGAMSMRIVRRIWRRIVVVVQICKWEDVEAGVGWDCNGKGNTLASCQLWYSNTCEWRNRHCDAYAGALLKKLVVDANTGVWRYWRDVADGGARWSKTIVATAGARWKKCCRRGVDVAELVVWILGNNDGRRTNQYPNNVWRSQNWKRNCVCCRRHLRKYWYLRTLMNYRRGSSPVDQWQWGSRWQSSGCCHIVDSWAGKSC